MKRPAEVEETLERLLDLNCSLREAMMSSKCDRCGSLTAPAGTMDGSKTREGVRMALEWVLGNIDHLEVPAGISNRERVSQPLEDD